MENTKRTKREIKSVEDLIALSKNPKLWQEHFIQKADLDMAGIANFSPIGNREISFNGSFCGNGMVIKNLTINCPQIEGVGLFGYCDVKANVQSVILINCNITGADAVGGICGWNEGGRIEYCEVSGTIKATENYDAIGCVVGCNCDGGIVEMNIGECKIITDEEVFTDDKECGYNKVLDNN